MYMHKDYGQFFQCWLLDTGLQVSPSQWLSGGLVPISNMILEIGHAKQGVKNIFSGKH